VAVGQESLTPARLEFRERWNLEVEPFRPAHPWRRFGFWWIRWRCADNLVFKQPSLRGHQLEQPLFTGLRLTKSFVGDSKGILGSTKFDFHHLEAACHRGCHLLSPVVT
jgi:hypothetical protein